MDAIDLIYGEKRRSVTADVNGSLQLKKVGLREEDASGSATELSDFGLSELDSLPSIRPSFQQPLYQPFQIGHPSSSSSLLRSLTVHAIPNVVSSFLFPFFMKPSSSSIHSDLLLCFLSTKTRAAAG